MGQTVVIVDYQVGNLQSVKASFARVGMETVISRDSKVIKSASAIVLPGVGAFPTAMTNLSRFNLIESLKECAAAGTPFLGICLGMQVLFERGLENGIRPGLGLLLGQVEPLKTTEKLPHMGWNQLHFNQENPLCRYLKAEDETYFVHSYYANCPEDEVIAYTEYGDIKIPAIVGKENVLGCQFHPEKSGPIGQLILKAFKEML